MTAGILQKSLFELFYGHTGKTTYTIPKELAISCHWQTSRTTEFAFLEEE